MFARAYSIAAIIAGTVAAYSAPVHAAVLYNNTSTTVSGADNADVTDYIASSFTTGSATTTLSASLLLQQITAGVDALSIYSSSGLYPDTLVGTLTAGSTPSSSSAGLVTYSSSSLNLSASTTYWLVLSSTGSVAWSYSDDSTLTNAWAGSSDAGATWSVVGDSYPYVLSVSDVVPEPTALAAMAVAGLGILRRKRG